MQLNNSVRHYDEKCNLGPVVNKEFVMRQIIFPKSLVGIVSGLCESLKLDLKVPIEISNFNLAFSGLVGNPNRFDQNFLQERLLGFQNLCPVGTILELEKSYSFMLKKNHFLVDCSNYHPRKGESVPHFCLKRLDAVKLPIVLNSDQIVQISSENERFLAIIDEFTLDFENQKNKLSGFRYFIPIEVIKDGFDFVDSIYFYRKHTKSAILID